MMAIAAATRHGRKYGYSFQNLLLNNSGYLSEGFENEPPISGLGFIEDKKSKFERDQ